MTEPAGREPNVAEPGDLAQLLRGPLSAEEHAARVAAVRKQFDDEERALQAAVVRQIPFAAESLAALNRASGFRHPLVTWVARRHSLATRVVRIARPLVRVRTRGRARRARCATLRRAPARSPGRDPEPARPLEAAA